MARVAGSPIPRHGPLDTFLRGPIPWPWWSRAASLPGRALHVASAVRYLVGWRGGPTIFFALGDLDPFLGVDRQTARRGLRALEFLALVEVESRAGCKLLVRACEVADDPTAASSADPSVALVGSGLPVTWSGPACRIRDLGNRRVDWCEIRGRRIPARWVGDLARGRKSVRIGLRALESDGLILVELRSVRRSIVTLLPAMSESPKIGQGDRLSETDQITIPKRPHHSPQRKATRPLVVDLKNDPD